MYKAARHNLHRVLSTASRESFARWRVLLSLVREVVSKRLHVVHRQVRRGSACVPPLTDGKSGGETNLDGWVTVTGAKLLQGFQSGFLGLGGTILYLGRLILLGEEVFEEAGRAGRLEDRVQRSTSVSWGAGCEEVRQGELT
jgi:hypothetical protein